MKKSKLIITALVLCAVSLFAFGCKKDGAPKEADNTAAKEYVQNGLKEALEVYDYFKARTIPTKDQIVKNENGVEYLPIDLDGITTCADLTALLGKYFSENFIKTNIHEFGGKNPVFCDIDGKACIINDGVGANLDTNFDIATVHASNTDASKTTFTVSTLQKSGDKVISDYTISLLLGENKLIDSFEVLVTDIDSIFEQYSE